MRLSPLFAAIGAGSSSLMQDNARQRKERQAAEQLERERKLEDVLAQRQAESHAAAMRSRTLEDALTQERIDDLNAPKPRTPAPTRTTDRGIEEFDETTGEWTPTGRTPYAAPKEPKPQPSTEPKMSDVGTLRGQFNSEQTAKDAAQVATSYRKIKHAATNPSAAGDLSLIFGYMRMLDPASTVREGEQASAQNAAGVPDQVRNVYNRALKGERLNPNQRTDFLKQAEGIANAQRQSLRGVITRYSDIATRNKLNPKDIVYDPFEDESGGVVPDHTKMSDEEFAKAYKAGVFKGSQ